MEQGEQRTVIIHKLSRKKKALDACLLAERLYKAGRRSLVWIPDSGRAAMLDQYLWTFSQYSFVPHALCQDGGTCEEPVAVVAGTIWNPNRADVLLVVGRLDPGDSGVRFAEIHDLDAGTDEDVGKPEAWEAAGFEVRMVRGLGA